MVRYLLDGGFVDAATSTAAALDAAKYGHAAVVEVMLVQQGVRLEPEHWPLLSAIHYGRVGAVRMMLARGAPASEAAVKAALKGGQLSAVRQLLAAGGTLPLASAQTMLEPAVLGGCAELVRMVLDIGIEPTVSVLSLALERGHDDVLWVLLQHDSTRAEEMVRGLLYI